MKKLLLGLALLLLTAGARGQVINALCTLSTTTGCANANAGVTATVTTADAYAIDCTAGWVCDAHISALTTSDAVVTLECKADITDTNEDWYPCFGPVTSIGNYQAAGVSYYTSLARAGFYRVKDVQTTGTVYVKFARYKR